MQQLQNFVVTERIGFRPITPTVGTFIEKPSKHWLASYGYIPKEINPNNHSSVLALCEQAMSQYADCTAFYSLGEGLSYRQIDEQSLDFAAYLQGRLGVRKGDRVAVMLPNVAEAPISLIGIMRCGAAVTSIALEASTDEFEHQLKDAGVETLICYSELSSALQHSLKSSDVKNVIYVSQNEKAGSSLSFSQCLAEGTTLSLNPVDIQSDDLVYLHYSNDREGLFRGVMLSHRNVVANTEQFKTLMPSFVIPKQETLVTMMPLQDCFTIIMTIVYFSVGAENHLVMDADDISGIRDTLAAARPTVFPGVTKLFNSLVNNHQLTDIDWSSLKLTINVDSPASASRTNKWQEITGSVILEGYGLPETSAVLSLTPKSIVPCSNAGLPVPSTDIKLLNSKGESVAVGEAGEICAKGPQVTQGYWNLPEITSTAFTSDGYFRTGDIGMFDEAGYLKIIEKQDASNPVMKDCA